MSNLWILYLGEFLQSDPRGKVYGINEFSHLLEVSGKKQQDGTAEWPLMQIDSTVSPASSLFRMPSTLRIQPN